MNENINNSDTQRLEKIYDFFVSGKEIPNEVCVGNNACALLKLATPSIRMKMFYITQTKDTIPYMINQKQMNYQKKKRLK